MENNRYRKKQVDKKVYLEHRLVAEQMLGRPLGPDEVVKGMRTEERVVG